MFYNIFTAIKKNENIVDHINNLKIDYDKIVKAEAKNVVELRPEVKGEVTPEVK
jgi:hypothetical protein